MGVRLGVGATMGGGGIEGGRRNAGTTGAAITGSGPTGNGVGDGATETAAPAEPVDADGGLTGVAAGVAAGTGVLVDGTSTCGADLLGVAVRTFGELDARERAAGGDPGPFRTTIVGTRNGSKIKGGGAGAGTEVGYTTTAVGAGAKATTRAVFLCVAPVRCATNGGVARGATVDGPAGVGNAVLWTRVGRATWREAECGRANTHVNSSRAARDAGAMNHPPRTFLRLWTCSSLALASTTCCRCAGGSGVGIACNKEDCRAYA